MVAVHDTQNTSYLSHLFLTVYGFSFNTAKIEDISIKDCNVATQTSTSGKIQLANLLTV